MFLRMFSFDFLFEQMSTYEWTGNWGYSVSLPPSVVPVVGSRESVNSICTLSVNPSCSTVKFDCSTLVHLSLWKKKNQLLDWEEWVATLVHNWHVNKAWRVQSEDRRERRMKERLNQRVTEESRVEKLTMDHKLVQWDSIEWQVCE